MRAMGGNLGQGRRVHLIEQCRPSPKSVRMNKTKHFLILITVLLGSFVALMLGQGSTGTLQGRVLDPSGAVIPQAQVSVTSPSGKTVSTTADAAGSYRVPGLAAGDYTVNATTPGFAPFTAPVTLASGQAKTLNIAMQIQAEKQQVEVESDAPTVDTTPDQNANAVVLKGKDLDALSDDPDELENQLQALAGPAAGPNGGEVYIDGFTGGQIPPKSSIREIRINQNPFSAEFDRLGYGRIEILTKPGTDKLHGQIEARGNDSSFNSKNPILPPNIAGTALLLLQPARQRWWAYFKDGVLLCQRFRAQYPECERGGCD